MRLITLKSMASCMIQAKSLDPSLKVKAISSANHILNRSPHYALDGHTPFEAWCSRKLVVKHFRVFGCPAWAHISSRECKPPPPQPCTFIGYGDNVKAYRLMDPKTHEIFIERGMFTLRKVHLAYPLILFELHILWKLIVTLAIVL